MPLIVAHRGSSGKAPENTLAAFQLAVDEGADMIELDVRMTKDLELVVLHDKTVRRTTNGRGSIWNLTLENLRTLDAGSWFNLQFSSERIPTLSEAIDLLLPDTHINIEVKTDGDPRKRSAFHKLLAEQLRAKQCIPHVVVSSFDRTFLSRLHAFASDIPLGVLYLPVRDMGKKPSAFARRVGASSFVCSITQLRKRMAKDVHAARMTLGCYGVNTRRQLEKALDYGVDLIITDYPKEIRVLAGKLRRWD